MRQPVRSAKIDEHAEAAHAAHLALANVTFMQFLDQAFLLLHPPLLQGGAFG